MKEPIISLELYLSGKEELDPVEQSQKTLETMHQAGHELGLNIHAKCKRIKEMDGKPVSVIGLKLTGETFIEYVELIYMQEGERLSKRYSIEDFYKI